MRLLSSHVPWMATARSTPPGATSGFDIAWIPYLEIPTAISWRSPNGWQSPGCSTSVLCSRHPSRTEKETGPGRETQLLPLSAARRRRGLTAIKGHFPGLLSALEFVRDGVTKDELLDLLHTSAPDSKRRSLVVTINVLKSELGVIRLDGGRYVLTERGENVLESQDPSDLADWLLTRVLGVDNAIVALRDQGSMPTSDLTALLRTVNPGWTSDYVPQAIIGWLRSMGVIHTEGSVQALTDVGRQWAARIHWQPESLPPDPEPPSPEPVWNSRQSLPRS